MILTVIFVAASQVMDISYELQTLIFGCDFILVGVEHEIYPLEVVIFTCSNGGSISFAVSYFHSW